MLITIMRHQNVSTAALSAKTGIPEHTIETYIRNCHRISLEDGLKLADALDVAPIDLVMSDRPAHRSVQEILEDKKNGPV